jgi:hypothetical protein
MTEASKKKKPWLVKSDKNEKSDKSEKLPTKIEKSQLRNEKSHSKIERNQVEYYLNV